ncbi:hypothetical protein SAMN05660226_02387 [Parapedobacter luteus]|uniref:Uncharacterized protein n=1 Tax=Parapedobacter luteus TaxID=623280 RepID=A0A1T5CVR4_9SPHI|nr:hypothetical protein [Parapedobacter luteus]SKB63426.1 hypothetical protein SAMN05660226_02387 [Parapedobacter luteus]
MAQINKKVTYGEIHKHIKLLVDMAKGEFHCKRVFLLGGIIINTSPGYNDAVEIYNFEVVDVGATAGSDEDESHSIMHSEVFKNP